MSLVYLDNNATTRPAPEVVEAMLPFYTEWYGNASSTHRFGQRSRQAIDEARGHIATLVGCAESDLLFTGIFAVAMELAALRDGRPTLLLRRPNPAGRAR